VTTTPPGRDRVRAQRQDIINRAVAHMDATSPDDLTALLAQASFKPAFRRDPRLLRDNLAGARPDDAGSFFAAFKAAQRVLHAAGLYQYPHTTR
jgi:hypothetical protein